MRPLLVLSLIWVIPILGCMDSQLYYEPEIEDFSPPYLSDLSDKRYQVAFGKHTGTYLAQACIERITPSRHGFHQFNMQIATDRHLAPIAATAIRQMLSMYESGKKEPSCYWRFMYPGTITDVRTTANLVAATRSYIVVPSRIDRLTAIGMPWLDDDAEEQRPLLRFLFSDQ
jgi:hypothetical protein